MVVSLAVTNDYYVYPHNSSQFPLGPGEATSNLLANITALFRLHLILLSIATIVYKCSVLEPRVPAGPVTRPAMEHSPAWSSLRDT